MTDIHDMFNLSAMEQAQVVVDHNRAARRYRKPLLKNLRRKAARGDSENPVTAQEAEACEAIAFIGRETGVLT